MKSILLYCRSLRLFSLPVSILPAIAGISIVLPLKEWRVGILLAELAGIALLHIVGNLLNDYFDFHYGVDHRADEDIHRPGRLLVHGQLSPSTYLKEIFVALLLLIPVVGYLTKMCGMSILIFGGIALVMGWAYTGPPFRLKYHALGEVTIFLVFGPLLLAGTTWAQTGHVEVMVLLISIPLGMATTAILVGNNLRDAEEDKEAGIRTLVHLIGESFTRYLYAGLLIASILIITVLPFMVETTPWLITAPLLLLPARGMILSVLKGERRANIDAQTAQFVALISMFLILVLTLFKTSTGII